jgi:hypothetical protein
MTSKQNSDRRRILKFATVGGIATILLPSKWVAPIVKSVVVPAHAAASAVATTTGTGTTGTGTTGTGTTSTGTTGSPTSTTTTTTTLVPE